MRHRGGGEGGAAVPSPGRRARAGAGAARRHSQLGLCEREDEHERRRERSRPRSARSPPTLVRGPVGGDGGWSSLSEIIDEIASATDCCSRFHPPASVLKRR